MNAYEIIKRPIITEKTVAMSEDPDREQKVYCFEVDKRANKVQIRKAIEELYQVRVRQVRTVWCRGKPRRYRMKLVRRPDWKKAYVTLAPGETINIL